MTPEMIGIFIEVVILLGFGFFFAKRNILTEQMKNGLSGLLLKAVLPISILGSSQIAYDAATLNGFAITLAITLVYYFGFTGIIYVLTRKLPIPDGGNRIFTTLCVFGNVGFIGIPLATQFFGSTGLMYAFALNVAYNLAMFSVGLIILSGDKKNSSLKKTLTDPCLICTVVMILLYIAPFRLPSFVTAAFTITGGMMTPLAMLIIGYEIAQMNVLELLKDKWSYLVSFVRLLVIPLIICGVMALLPIDSSVAKVIVFLLAMPCGTLNVILSQQYQCNPQFASRATTQTMILFLATVPVMLIVMNLLL